MSQSRNRMSKHQRRIAFRRRILVAVALVGLSLSLVALPSAEQTEAYWTDREYTAAGLTAARLSPPQVNSPVDTCRNPFIAGTVLQITWRLSETEIHAGLVPSSNTTWRVRSSSSSSWTSITPSHQDLGNGWYRSTFSSGLLDNVGSLFGTTLIFEAEDHEDDGRRSDMDFEQSNLDPSRVARDRWQWNMHSDKRLVSIQQ